MKNIYLAIAVTFFLNVQCTGQKKTERTIAFYNVENLFDTLDTPEKDDAEFLPDARRNWNSERYWEKIQHINMVIDSLQTPVILGLCEVENETVVRDVINYGKLKGKYGVVHFESTDARGIDNAIIYDSSVLKLHGSGFIRFVMPPPSTPSRDIIWGKFIQGHDTLLTIVNHWPSRSGGQVESEPKRLIAANAARHFIDSVQSVNKRIDIVFMGDLNDHPDNLAPSMISDVLSPMISEKSGQFGGTHSYRNEWGVLDHIMVSKGFTKKKGMYVEKKSGRIYSNDFLLEEYKGHIVPFRTYGGTKYLGGFSDHFPVFIKVRI